MSYTTFKAKYKIQTNYLECYKVVSALKSFRKNVLASITITQKNTAESLLLSLNVCKAVYKCLIEKKASTPLKRQGKWLSEDEVIGNLEINWENTYRLPFLCTTKTKLRAFQFKFFPRRIATNDFLHKIGVKQVDSCSFCDGTTETLVHLFWNCKYSNLSLEKHFAVDFAKSNSYKRSLLSLLVFALVSLTTYLTYSFTILFSSLETIYTPAD